RASRRSEPGSDRVQDGSDDKHGSPDHSQDRSYHERHRRDPWPTADDDRATTPGHTASKDKALWARPLPPRPKEIVAANDPNKIAPSAPNTLAKMDEDQRCRLHARFASLS